MNRTVLRSFALPILLAFTSGCRDSKLSVPAPQSTPAAATQFKPASSTADRTQVADPAGLATRDVVPPASVSIISGNSPSEFIVHGNKDQFLRVQVESGDDAPLPNATITAMSHGGEEALKSLLTEPCMDGALYPLRRTGTINVSVQLEGRGEAKLDFTLLSSTDPLLDAGIRPEQISLSDKGVSEPHPFDPACGEIGDSWPASIIFRGNKFRFQIVQVQGYKELFPQDKGIELLASNLKSGAPSPDARHLPYANGGDAATVMTARPQLLKRPGWTAWRWIEGSSQCCDYPGGIFYVVEGLTNDGRFFFRMTAQIDHPDLKRLKPANVTAEGQDMPNRLDLEKALAAADPASFTPNLNELDAIAGSVSIRQ